MATVITIATNGDISINQKAIAADHIEAVNDIDPPYCDKKDGNNKEREVGKQKKKSVGILELFRFATCRDIIMLAVGIVAGIGHGMALPALIIVFGFMIDSFVDTGKYISILQDITPLLIEVGINPQIAIESPSLLLKYIPDIKANYTYIDTNIIQRQIDNDFLETMETYALYYVWMAFGVLFLTFFQVVCWMLPAERQIKRIRKAFFRNVLRQEIGWFDVNESGHVTTCLSSNINKIHEGIGDKVSTFFQWISTTVTAFIVSFIYGWKLSIVILAVAPLVALSAGIMTKVLETMSSKEIAAYSKAGAIAEEVISSIRTVVAFGGQKKELERYKQHLGEARDIGIKKSLGNGISFGILYLIIFCADALGFWYGSKLTREEPEIYSIGNVLIIFFGIVVGAIDLGNAMPNLQSFNAAREAAYDIFQLIEQVPSIDSSSDSGIKLESLQGSVEFRNVTFRYPARKEVQVLKGLNLVVKRGQTVGLVGKSGCGKSTMVQLLQRFYDVDSGQILVDGVDIKELNVKWLRQHIGIVSQEPVLFASTIADNIRYGREDVTLEELERAAKMANAHDFISALPEKYETLVGERGAQLSGGQKQRIAIARALVRDPKILLLDEATSALDTESEAIVQEALDKARAGRTTIVIAHRLSTIKMANTIAVFKDGVIVEIGRHDQLMQIGGVYATLLKHQTKHYHIDDDDDDEESSNRINDVHVIGGVGKETEDVSYADEKNKKNKQGVFVRLMRINSPEWYIILFGCLGSVAFGTVQPAFAVIFSSIVEVYASPDQDYQEREINKLVAILVGVAVGSLLAITLQGYMFGKSGENLTLRLRQMAFKAILRQDIAYFDDPKNATGALTTRLATEATMIQGASGARVGKVLENISSVGTALIIGFIYGWQLTLLILAFIPMLILAGALEYRLLSGVAGKNKEALECAGNIVTEGIDNIRTVASLSREKTVLDLYLSHLKGPIKQAIRKSFYIGFAFAVAQSVVFFLHAAGFYFGAWLVRGSYMEFSDVFKVFAAIVFGAMAIGQASAFAPDVSKAQVAAVNMFQLLDRVPEIDADSVQGQTLDETGYSSRLTFKNVTFRYPMRPDVEVLGGINLSVEQGQTVALVGASGCGKSTVMQLIQRFYDPTRGEVRIGQCNIRNLNVQNLRSKIGIVAQEPVLFDRSIAENIAYGDNERHVDIQEVIYAARIANIHDFIESLPDGYNTTVGSKGTQLSGGQKQRVAIARALIRNPKILLFDEATSALDTESEKIVQEAVQKVREGRTCIVIAHRLTTVRDADKICVIRHGRIVEEGNHTDLISNKGIYYKMNQTRSTISNN